MTKDEALKLALDFIERVNKDGWILADLEPEMYAAITAIKEALAQPEQEPVAWFSTLPDGKLSIKIVGKPTDGNWEPLYTTPSQRPWVGLTYEEETELIRLAHNHAGIRFYIQAAEAKLKEKNNV